MVYRTEWSPIWSVIIRVITKSGDRAARVRFVYHEYDYAWFKRRILHAPNQILILVDSNEYVRLI